MKKSEFIDSMILDNLKPSGHSFGLIHDDSIIHKVEWHQHNEYELLFMERAYGTFLIWDTVFTCNDSDSLFLLFGKNLPHSFYYDEAVNFLPEKVSVFSLLFTEESLGKNFFNLPEMSKTTELLEGASRGYIITGGTKDKLERVIRTLYESEGISRLQLFLQILAVLTNSTELTTISGSPPPERNQYKNQRINTIVHWVYSNYNRDITVTEAAQHIHMSPQAFTLYFKKTTGQTFLKFVNQLRISRVCEQLLTTDDDITSIAFRNGFNNLSNFNRRFKQIKKMPPRQFRNSRY